ncbi:MAG TPA: transglutaminase-like cysteine peptidase [Devosiaceae bacterium]
MKSARAAILAAVFAFSTLTDATLAAVQPEKDSLQSFRAMSLSQSTAAPTGFMVFCLRSPASCRVSGKSKVDYTSQLATTLRSVNSLVNRSIRPRPDRGDVWLANVRYGDCEDYALTKRERLIRMGIPAGALRIATARTRSGEGHAVLVVRTDHGDFVLDNMNNSVRPWFQTGLRWIAMSGANPLRWNRIS